MNHDLSWQYDEFKQVGKDYSSKAEVDIYDSSHADFRNIEAESIKVLDSLEIKTSDVSILDLEPALSPFKRRDAVPEYMPSMFHRP
jgi:putative AdoMet-dependent methyltransferase